MRLHGQFDRKLQAQFGDRSGKMRTLLAKIEVVVDGVVRSKAWRIVHRGSVASTKSNAAGELKLAFILKSDSNRFPASACFRFIHAPRQRGRMAPRILFKGRRSSVFVPAETRCSRLVADLVFYAKSD
jgi:hypothetical protein